VKSWWQGNGTPVRVRVTHTGLELHTHTHTQRVVKSWWQGNGPPSKCTPGLRGRGRRPPASERRGGCSRRAAIHATHAPTVRDAYDVALLPAARDLAGRVQLLHNAEVLHGRGGKGVAGWHTCNYLQVFSMLYYCVQLLHHADVLHVCCTFSM